MRYFKVEMGYVYSLDGILMVKEGTIHSLIGQ